MIISKNFYNINFIIYNSKFFKTIAIDIALFGIIQGSITTQVHNNNYKYVTVHAKTNHMLYIKIDFEIRKVRTANYNEFRFSPK